MKTVNHATVSIPLTLSSHALAREYANAQMNPKRAKQVYLNTLAIEAVKTYLDWLQIPTRREECVSGNVLGQTLSESADLLIEGKGKVECRPVLPGETMCSIPPETWGDRLIYIAVQLNRELTEGTLLGYLPNVQVPEIPLSHFHSVETLLAYLYPVTPTPVRLTQWLQDRVESGWQTLTELLLHPEPELAVNFRSAYPVGTQTAAAPAARLKRGKRITFEHDEEPIGLFMGIHPLADTEDEFDISVEVYPLGSEDRLPEDLQVLILDNHESVVMQAASRGTKGIKLDFSAEVGDRFSVKVALGEISITEQFMM